jgi:rubrerythrin
MTLEEAIQTAITFETKVRDIYADAAKRAPDETGKKVFAVLAREEQGHLDFLRKRLGEWQRSGKLVAEKLGTVVPSASAVKEGLAAMRREVRERPDRTLELELLKKALAAELETGAFYRRMVAELDAEGQRLFAPFAEIEDAHYAIVQAQIDSLNGMGFWFDRMEFDLEAG